MMHTISSVSSQCELLKLNYGLPVGHNSVYCLITHLRTYIYTSNGVICGEALSGMNRNEKYMVL